MGTRFLATLVSLGLTLAPGLAGADESAPPTTQPSEPDETQRAGLIAEKERLVEELAALDEGWSEQSNSQGQPSGNLDDRLRWILDRIDQIDRMLARRPK